MSNDPTILTADFPKAVRGYAPLAVDDFVRQIGDRLANMQSQIDELTARAEAEGSRANRLALDLDAANKKLAGYGEKESAIANAFLSMEQHRGQLEQSLELERSNLRMQAEQVVSEARNIAEQTIEEARQQAESIRAEAERSVAESAALIEASSAVAEERLRALCAEYDSVVEQIRRTLEGQLALLPPSSANRQERSDAGVAVTAKKMSMALEPLTDAA